MRGNDGVTLVAVLGLEFLCLIWVVYGERNIGKLRLGVNHDQLEETCTNVEGLTANGEEAPRLDLRGLQ